MRGRGEEPSFNILRIARPRADLDSPFDFLHPHAFKGVLRRRHHRAAELEEQLRLKETLARLGELTAGLAHEFRNGLATIHGYARLVNVESLARVEPYAKDSRVALLKDGTRVPISRAGYERLKGLL